MKRQAINIGILGDKGTGKTTVAMDLAERKYEQEQRSVYVLTRSLDGQLAALDEIEISEITNDEKGIFKISDKEVHSDDLSDIAREILTTFRRDEITNCTLLIDDASSFIPNYQVRYCYDLINNTRHLSIDFVFIYHRLNQIPKWLQSHLSWLLIFKSSYNVQSSKNLFEFSEKQIKNIIETFEKVNASKNKYEFEAVNIIE